MQITFNKYTENEIPRLLNIFIEGFTIILQEEHNNECNQYFIIILKKFKDYIKELTIPLIYDKKNELDNIINYLIKLVTNNIIYINLIESLNCNNSIKYSKISKIFEYFNLLNLISFYLKTTISSFNFNILTEKKYQNNIMSFNINDDIKKSINKKSLENISILFSKDFTESPSKLLLAELSSILAKSAAPAELVSEPAELVSTPAELVSAAPAPSTSISTDKSKYDIKIVHEIISMTQLNNILKIFKIVILKIGNKLTCPPCNSLIPIYKEFANKNENENIIFISLDESVFHRDEELGDYYLNLDDRIGYPMLMISNYGKITKYNGLLTIERELNGFLNSIKNGGANKYKKTDNKITVIYKKKEYTRVIYICERKKYVKINKSFMLLSKLKKI
jgi:thiol-disulfide isomerase/thioredoxin